MKRNTLLLIGLALVIACFAVIVLMGRTYTIQRTVDPAASAEDFDVQFETTSGEPKPGIVQLADKRVENGTLYLTLEPLQRGKVFITVTGPNDFAYMDSIYVHHFRIITTETYFGNSRGSAIIPWAAALYLALILWYVIRQYREGMRRTIYQYKNVRNLGWIIFLAAMLIGQIPYLLGRGSLIDTVKTTLSSMTNFAFIAFPIAFVVSILVTISNFRLMRREGRNWRNMLGMMLGLLVCLSTIFPFALGEYLQRSTVVDVHNEQGWAMYAEMAVTNTILVAVTYLECILIGTIALSVKAARSTPDPDRDYMLILGCQIKKDGTLTPLLRGRADRALEFAGLQRGKAGKELVFVPSGGQGADEVMPEGQAIRNYLIETGVAPEAILTEDRSENTEKNFQYSIDLIRRHCGEAEPKIAFATTNYHVFRSGILAEQMGVHAQGIGGRTRTYFWVNAFIREFIATVYSERRRHFIVVVALIALILLMVGMVYLSNAI